MGPRDFDPVRLGGVECAAWVGYYRRDWRTVLVSSVRMVRIGFGLSWPRTVAGAWYVLRANRAWAPYPRNDPTRARAYMRRFYALVGRDGALHFDPARAAELEVEWWRVHRAHQREGAVGEADLTDALAALYGYVYGVEKAAVREAAEQRMLAMRYSDKWHRRGCDLDDELLGEERAALVASYTALLAAVRR